MHLYYWLDFVSLCLSQVYQKNYDIYSPESTSEANIQQESEKSVPIVLATTTDIHGTTVMDQEGKFTAFYTIFNK